MKLKDSNGKYVCYDASVYDFFGHLKGLGRLISFFIENNLIQFSDENYDFEVPQEDGGGEQRGQDYTRKNFKMNQDKLDQNFHYGYLVTKVFELEQKFIYQKARIVKMFTEICENICDMKILKDFYDFVIDFCARRPMFD